MTRYIALFGGSFNPPTDAHRDIGLQLLKQAGVDEVWYLVTPQNRLKPAKGMASFTDRVAMTRLNIEGLPGLAVQDIEATYARTKPNGIIPTAETLRMLTRDYPDTRFVWVMGADNFTTFHNWEDYQYIAEHFPMIIVPRAGYMDAALKGQTASYLPRVDGIKDLRWNSGWHMLDYPETEINATHCRDDLEAGRPPPDMRPEVARFALDRGIYHLRQ